MVANEEILRKNQAGFESVRGTGVPATRIVYANIAPSYERALREFVDTTGTYEAQRRLAYQRQRVTFAVSELLTFQDWAWWLQLGLRGNVAGVGDAGSPEAFVYTFTPSLAVDDLEAITLEWNHVGNPYESTQCMLNSFTVRIDPDNEGGWIMDGELLARDIATTTYTGAISDRTTEVIPAPGTELFIDPTTIGTTPVPGKLISASVTINNAIHFKAFSEDVTSFAANKVGRGRRAVNAQFVLEFDDDTEFANYRAAAGTKRFVRLQSEGSIIHDAVTNKAVIDLAGYWSSIAWSNREGNIIATFGLSGFYDVASGYTIEAEVTNDLATLP